MVTPELPLDVLGDIGERLELLDFLRFGGVCSSWHMSSLVVEAHSSHLQPKPQPQIPWLMLYSPDDKKKKNKNTKKEKKRMKKKKEEDDHDNKKKKKKKKDYDHDNHNNNNNVYFFSLVESKAYKFQLPETTRGSGHCIGSSEGFLISAHKKSGKLLAVNPLTRQQIQLPHTASLLPSYSNRYYCHFLPSYPKTDRWHCFHKAIVCPSTQAVVVCYGVNKSLAFALPGQDKWTTLETQWGGKDDGPTFKYGHFNDMIFHKGRLHAINFMGTLWVYDLLRCTTTGDTKPCLRTSIGPLADSGGFFRRYLVDDPTTDDLYLIFRDSDHDENWTNQLGPWSLSHRTIIFKVFKLDPDTYDWEEIHTLGLGGDLSLFLGFNRSLSLSQKDFPFLKSNRIYFTDDVAVSKIGTEDTTDGLLGDMGVFSLEDGSFEPLSISDDVLRRPNWPPPLWFTPAWKKV